MREELEKINRLIDNYLELIKRKEERIEMLKGFREQWRALDSFAKVNESNQDIDWEKRNIEKIYFKIEEQSRKMNNLVNNEMVSLMHQTKDI